jgi:hypothetical protein
MKNRLLFIRELHIGEKEMGKWEKFRERIKRGLEPPDDEETLNENTKSPKSGVIIPQISA